MLTLKTTILATLSLSTALVAQTVSPIGFASVEAPTSNTFPFSGIAFSYQQIHGDLRGTPLPITRLAWRRDGATTGTFAARAVTVDVWIGDTNLAAVTGTFATNYIGTPTQVVTNRTFNFPDHSPRPLSTPAPFTAVVTLDNVYVYIGTLDLLWELRMTGSAPSAAFQMDAVSGAGAILSNHGRSVGSGTGCTTANGTMRLHWNGSTSSTLHTLSWAIAGAPSTTQATVLIGAQVSLLLPGLCTSIETTGTFFTLNGTTTSTGTMLTPTGVTTPYNPTIVGFPLTAQAATLDAAQPGLPLALSNGVTNFITDSTQGPVRASRIYASGNASATSGTLANNNALITQFQ